MYALSFSCAHDRDTIAQQRKRILYLHDQVSLAQQQRAIVEDEVDDEEEEKQPTAQVTNVANEPTSTLRNRLFSNKEKEEMTDTSTERVLQHHRMVQDELSDAMLGMARGLKQRSIAFGEALKEDSKVVNGRNTTNNS